MAKTGRNEPCPCGSGKKYKKCCYAKEAFLSQEKKDELLDLADGLVEFMIYYYDLEVEEEIDTLCQEEALHLIMDEGFKAGYLAWRIFQANPISDETPFDDFLDSVPLPVLPSWMDVGNWRTSYPSFYEITKVQGNTSQLMDIVLEINHEIFFSGDSPFEEGDIFAGTLLAAGPRASIVLFPPAFLGKRGEGNIIQVINREYKKYLKSSRKSGDYKIELLQEFFIPIFVNVYSSFVDSALTALLQILAREVWEKDVYGETAKLFLERVKRKKLYSLPTLRGVAMLWTAYCANHVPRVNKADAPAAALEYLSAHTEGLDITQRDVGEEYGVSPGTISRWFGQLMDHADSLAHEFMKDEEDADDELPPYNVLGERLMKKIGKVMANREWTSEEELNTFLTQNSNLIAEGAFDDELDPLTNKEEAQNLLFDAFEARAGKRKSLIQKALELYPNSPDAYFLQAEEHPDPEEALKLYLQGVRAGEADLGEEFIAREKGNFWSMMETRPYMRAKMGYAFALLDLGRREEAVRQFKEILELNPQDNQGARYPLLTALLEREEYKEAKKLLLDFPEDHSAEFLYNHVLVEYGLRGLTFNLYSILKEAKKSNPYVPAYLLGEKPLPSHPPSHVGMGDRKEAISYAYQNMHLWQGKDNLLALLRKK